MVALWLDIDAVARVHVEPVALVSVYTRPWEKQPVLPVAPSNTRRNPAPFLTSCGSYATELHPERAVPVDSNKPPGEMVDVPYAVADFFRHTTCRFPSLVRNMLAT